MEAAWAASHSKDSFLKRKYQALEARRGKRKALIAIAHKMLIAAYFILKRRELYKEPDDARLMEKRKQALIRKYNQRLHELNAL